MSRRILPSSPVTVGRDAELAAIRDAVGVAAAARGRGGMLFLIGEPGAGKSRLLREAAEAAQAAGMLVLSAEAPAAVAPPPFGLVSGALRQWLRRTSGDLDALAPYAAGLRMAVPEWPGGRDEPALAPDQLRLLVLEGALQAFVVAARGSGAAVVLDDVHNADPETIAFLVHAATEARRHRLLFVAAMRPGDGPAQQEAFALARKQHATMLQIEPLDRPGTAALVRAIAGGAPPGELIDEMQSRAGGNPLLVEELLEAHAAAGTLTRDGVSIAWSRPDRRVVPKTILEAAQHRMWGLSENARFAVAAASVIGRADPVILAAVAGIPPTSVVPAITEAIDAALLDAGGGFRHALIREAVYDSLVDAHRRLMHERCLDALDESAFSERASHAEALGHADEAAALLLAAARRDLAANAPASAAAAVERAIALSPAGAASAALRDVLAAALTAMGRWDDALRADRAANDETPSRLARMARNALLQGKLDEADALLARASGDGSDGALLALSGLVGLWRGDLERAEADGRAALAAANGDPAVECDALDVIGRAAEMSGRRDEAIGLFRRWASIAERASMTASHLQALMELGNVEYMAHFDPSALREVRRKAGDAGAFSTQVLADLSLTWVLGSSAMLDEAIAAAEEAVELCRHFGLGLAPHALVALSWACGRREAGSGLALAEEARAAAPGDADVAMLCDENVADSALREGRLDVACDGYDAIAAAMLANPSAAASMAPFVRPSVLAMAGRNTDAKTAIEQARDLPARERVWINRVWFSASEALVNGSSEDFERALAPATDRGALERAIALTIGARTMGGAKATAWLREALEVFDRAGAETDAARTRAALRERGERAPRRRGAGGGSVPAPLAERGVTRREAEVLAMIGRGLSNPQIAEALYLSVRTVESHVSSLLLKLGAPSRAALVAISLSPG